jgi:branched-chain amino acid transport system permease protein
VLLEEFLRDFKELRFSIFGLMVIAVVLFLPRGIMGFITRRHEIYSVGASKDA